MTLTDGSRRLLGLMEANLHNSMLHGLLPGLGTSTCVDFRRLLWNDLSTPLPEGPFDLVIGSDVTCVPRVARF